MSLRQDVIEELRRESARAQRLWGTETWLDCVPSQLLRDALELLTAADEEARPLGLYEVLGGAGGGWAEEWYEAEAGEPEVFMVRECGWCYGNLIFKDGDTVDANYVVSHYLKPYGIRIWSAKPTDEQRKTYRWEEDQ